MKKYTAFLLLLMPIISVAQNFQNMSEEDMQNMMQKMQNMQSCMKNIDQNTLTELEQRSHQFEAEINSLCSNGKRDEAQEMAISMGKEMSNDPSLQEMRKCGEMMQGMMPELPFMSQDLNKENSSYHVCD